MLRSQDEEVIVAVGAISVVLTTGLTASLYNGITIVQWWPATTGCTTRPAESSR